MAPRTPSPPYSSPTESAAAVEPSSQNKQYFSTPWNMHSKWWWLGLLYFAGWMFLPALLATSLPLDVVEGITWGHAWQWGYYKHPPFSSWVLYGFYAALGNSGPFVLSQLCVLATLYFVWRLGRALGTPQQAWLGALLTLGVAYYTRPALEFNHNIAQMPIWAALGYFTFIAWQKQKTRDWVILGMIAGFGLLTKYSVSILLMVLLGYLIISSRGKIFLSWKFWLAFFIAACIFAPHLLWLWESHWLPMEYASRRSGQAMRWPRLQALGFLGTQALNHLPLLLIVAVAFLSQRRHLSRGAADPKAWRTPENSYMLCLALGPGLLVTLLGVLTGARLYDMWGTPMWAFSGLLVALWLPRSWLATLQATLERGLLVWLVVISLLSWGFLGWGAQLRQRPARTDWPQAALAEQARAAWHSVSTCGLDTIAGNYWIAGLAAVDTAQPAAVLLDEDPRFSPWATPQRLQQHGALWLWTEDSPPPLPAGLQPLTQAPQASQAAALTTHTGQFSVPWPRNPQQGQLTVHWRAWVPAGCAP